MTRLVVLAAVLVATALAAAPALAGKPGSGSTASVSATPNPASSGTTVWLEGCGYDTRSPAEIRINHSAGYTESYAAAVWYTGCMNPSPFVTSEAGTYTIEVYQRPPKPRNAAPQLKASTTLIVQ